MSLTWHRNAMMRGQMMAVAAASFVPAYFASEIGDVDRVTIEVQFGENIRSPGANYAAGVTIKKNAVAQTILSATRQADHKYVYYVINANGDTDDAFTWEYDDGPGDLESEHDGADLLDVSPQASTNYIGCHLYFNTEEDSVWLAMVA